MLENDPKVALHEALVCNNSDSEAILGLSDVDACWRL
jgi:hypothetical protein